MALAACAQGQLWHGGAVVRPWVRLLRRKLHQKAVRNLIWAPQHHSGAFFNLWLCLLWRTLPLPAVLSPFSSQLALPCSAAGSCCLLKVEVQKPIYRTVFLYCSFQQRDGFQLLKSSNILEFVRHIRKLDTKNILVLKIPSLETVLPFLHDGYLSFYILSFDISCSLLKSLFEINHSRVLPKVCSILQMVAHSLASG